jgi:hypothetical protein
MAEDIFTNLLIHHNEQFQQELVAALVERVFHPVQEELAHYSSKRGKEA